MFVRRTSGARYGLTAVLLVLGLLLTGCVDWVVAGSLPEDRAVAAAPAEPTAPPPTATFTPTHTPTPTPSPQPSHTPTVEPAEPDVVLVTVTPPPMPATPTPVPFLAQQPPTRTPAPPTATPEPVYEIEDEADDVPEEEPALAEPFWPPATVTPRSVPIGAGPDVREVTPGPAETAPPTNTPGPSPTPERACVGDERMMFMPSNPMIGQEVTITVTSSFAHTGVRLTGPLNPQLQSMQTQGGTTTWTWRVTPTEDRRYDWNFYVQDGFLCTTNGFNVSQPTPTPTNTPTPTPTPIPVPHIERMNPTSGLPGQVVTIHGQRFGTSQGNSLVLFDRMPVPSGSVLQWGETFVTLTFPTRPAGRYEVTIIVNGQRSNTVLWDVRAG